MRLARIDWRESQAMVTGIAVPSDIADSANSSPPQVKRIGDSMTSTAPLHDVDQPM